MSDQSMRPGQGGYYTQTTGNDPQGRGAYATPGRTVYGVSVGVIQLPVDLAMTPGNVGNASTFGFPLLYDNIGDVDPMWLVANKPHPAIRDNSIEAAKRLQAQGVRCIVGNCGFFANYQDEISAELEIPFFSSSLLQVPFIVRSLRADQKLGIITADGSKLRAAPALANCGLTDPDRVVTYGAEVKAAMQEILSLTGHYSPQGLEQALVEIAKQMVEEHPEVGAILLECTELSAHAHAIQDAVGLSVWDFTTLINWIHAGAVRRPFSGWM